MKVRLLSSLHSQTLAGRMIACALFVAFSAFAAIGQNGAISGPAYQVLDARAGADQAAFSVYVDQDSGFNHGFPSGEFGDIGTITIDTGCVDDPNDPNAIHGCAPPNDSTILDKIRGTVMRVTFASQSSSAGLNIEEPEDWGQNRNGIGYNLESAANVVFDARSPDGAEFQFGVAGCTTGYVTVPTSWTTITIPLSSLSCGQDGLNLSDVHILFAVAANNVYTMNGGTILLDNIHFENVPTIQQTALTFPLANQTFGVVPLPSPAMGNIPFPQDQVLRNLTTVYESAITVSALLGRGTSQDLADARLIANTFDYALHHDNHGDSLPTAPDGSTGVHNGYDSGDISFLNDQLPPKLGKAGDIRLAGYSATNYCQPSLFCLVDDDATGGNNAFVMLALLAAYNQFHDLRYLSDAREIATWILDNLADNSGLGYGGYYAGYFGLNVGMQGVLNQAKSTENNADIYAAFTALATIEDQLGNAVEVAKWTAGAKAAGDFVMLMYDSSKGRFNAGTIPADSALLLSPLVRTGSRSGRDIINTSDFLDSDTFPILAMAAAPGYANQIDWRLPTRYALQTFAQTITVGNLTFQGFDITPMPKDGPNGIAWEFTGQMVAVLRYVDRLYGQTEFEANAAFYQAQIRQAQLSAPFGDGQGLVAATLQDGDSLPPLQQCLDTTYQCIAERVGLAATSWAIFAERDFNPLQNVTLRSTTVVTRNSDGRLEAFARGTDNELWHKSQAVPGGPSWNPWMPLGGTLNSDPFVGQNADGRLEVFVLGGDSALWHSYQTSASGNTWSPWTTLGGLLFSDLAVGRNSDGRIEVFARGSDNALWHTSQVIPGGPNWNRWTSLGGILTSNPIVGQNADGRLEVFGLGGDSALWHISQTTPSGSTWSGWSSLGGLFSSNLVVGRNSDGRLEVFARGGDYGLWHTSQMTAGGQAWSGWTPLGGTLSSDPVVGQNADGRLEVFALGGDAALWHISQTVASGTTWSAWNNLGGALSSDVAVSENTDGRLEVFARGTDNALWHISQAVAGGPTWNQWASLGGALESDPPDEQAP